MTDSTDRRADTTRQQILRAASHQFAQRAYHEVGLDDILAEAELTKGAMYFHFRSKHALALAIIEERIADGADGLQGLLARKLSGLETVIAFFYLLAVQDINQDAARAALYLIGAVGRTERLQARLLGGWIRALVPIMRRAIDEGDIADQCDPHDVSRLMVSLYLGLCQTSDLDESEQFLLDLEKVWGVVLPGIVRPDRLDYLKQFLRRRAALAVSATKSGTSSV